MSERTNRFEEMVEYVFLFSGVSDTESTLEERNLIQKAFKSVVGSHRAAIRIISLI